MGNSRWYDVAPNLRPEAGLLAIRKGLGLFANIRPAYLYKELADACPLKKEIIGNGFDMVIMRELTGGLYFGDRYTKEIDGVTTAVDTLTYNENEIRRIAIKAFDIAMKRRKSVISVDKANVLDSSRLWRKVVEEVAKDYPEVTLTHMLVDNCAMQLVRNPNQFDTIVTSNIFGDILSDEASMIRMRAHEATEISGIKDIRYLEDFDSAVNSFVERTRGEGKMTFYLDLWKYTSTQAPTPAHEFAHKVQKDYPAAAIEEIFGEIAKMRAIKSDAEIEKMRVAQETTRQAIEAMMKYAYPGVNECALEGAFDFELSKHGVREHAFPSIVAGGKRATTLHYNTNNQDVQDGELVLIDLGSANEHYCADISRTFPVNGKFTERQKEVYNIVLGAQQLVIDNARPGMTYLDLNNMVIKYYEEELPKIGLLKDGKTVRDYYYHSVSHSLGLDCHDVTTPSLKTLRPGMVITVEPGLYIEEEGIGVRIEDDIIITEEKAINLSSNILKTVEDIEALMKK